MITSCSEVQSADDCIAHGNRQITHTLIVDDIRLQSLSAMCRGEGPAQTSAAAAGGHDEHVAWHAEDEWMDEYRDADVRGSRERSAPSARPGMAPEEEALIQVTASPRVTSHLHVTSGNIDCH